MDRPKLSRWQRLRLQRQLKQTHDARQYRRTLAILEFSRGQSVARIAQLLGVTRQSVYHWIDAYSQTHDPEALLDDERSGRPSLWTEDLRVRLGSWLEQSPDGLGYFAVNWTVPLLQEHLGHYTGQHLSDDTVRRELQRLGYVWKRTRYVLTPDPELEKKTADSQPHQELGAAHGLAG
jgi:transposase